MFDKGITAALQTVAQNAPKRDLPHGRDFFDVLVETIEEFEESVQEGYVGFCQHYPPGELPFIVDEIEYCGSGILALYGKLTNGKERLAITHIQNAYLLMQTVSQAEMAQLSLVRDQKIGFHRRDLSAENAQGEISQSETPT